MNNIFIPGIKYSCYEGSGSSDSRHKLPYKKVGSDDPKLYKVLRIDSYIN